MCESHCEFVRKLCVSLDVKESKIDFFVQNVKLLIVCKESGNLLQMGKEIFYVESVISARL